MFKYTSSNKLLLDLAWRIVFTLLLLSSSQIVLADNVREYTIKAAFLYNFSKFIDWPEGTFIDASGFRICIAGKNPFSDKILSSISENKTKSLQVNIKRIGNDGIVKGCQIVFISEPSSILGKHIIKSNHQLNLLTVSDEPGFTAGGGVIELFSVNRKVRFKVNLKAAKIANLRISSRLLSLAVKVESGEQL